MNSRDMVVGPTDRSLSRAHRRNDSHLVGSLDEHALFALADLFFEINIVEIDGQGRRTEDLLLHARVLLVEPVVQLADRKRRRQEVMLLLRERSRCREVE